MDSKIKTTAEKILGRRLTEKDGLNISEIEVVEKSLGIKLPTILRDFHLLVGNLDMFISSFESLLSRTLRAKCLCFWKKIKVFVIGV